MSPFLKTDYDVIIAGSGPAGVSTALHLLKYNPSLKDRILILEKKRHPRFKPCGGGISAFTESWLKRLNIRMDIPSFQLLKTRVIIHRSKSGEEVMELDGTWRTVIRKDFDQALVNHVKRLGISESQNEPLIDFNHDRNQVTVKTPERILTTRVLVGADGTKGRTRNILNNLVGREPENNTCPTLNYSVSLESLGGKDTPEHDSREAVIDFTHTFYNGYGGYAWSFPFFDQDQKCLNLGIGGIRREKNPRKQLMEIFKDFLNERNLPVIEKNIKAHPSHWFHPRSVISTERILLVGDAAGVDPLWGEGLSYCFGYGRAAAESIIRALKKDRYSFQDYSSRFLSHETGQRLANRYKIAKRVYDPGQKTVDRGLLSLSGFF